MRRRLVFVVESGTDVRLVDGLAEHSDLTVLARCIVGGAEVNRPPERDVEIRIGPAGRVGFARWTATQLLGRAGPWDAALVQGYGPAAFAANTAARLRRRPATMLVCSPVERYYRSRRAWPDGDKPYRPTALRALQAMAAANARIGRRYVVLSRHLADVVRSHGTRRPIHLIPVYGVDTDRFRPPDESRAAIRRRLGIPDGPPLVFFSSRIAPEKDAGTLLDAAARLRAREHPVRLLHLSGGHDAFLAAARAHGVDDLAIARDAVHPVRDLPQWYQAADLCVQASREEGLGFSPLEAMACGTPVVATAVGGLRETVLPGETGWTYPPGDAAALADALVEALGDPGEGRRRALAGRALVERRFERRRVFRDLDRVLWDDA